MIRVFKHGGGCVGAFESWPKARAHALAVGGFTDPTDPRLLENFPRYVRPEDLAGALASWRRLGIEDVRVSLVTVWRAGREDRWLAVDLQVRCELCP